MVTTPRQTFPELQALSAPVVDSDVLAVYRSPGPAKRTTASVLKTYAQTGLGTMATQNANAVAITGGVIADLTNCTSAEFNTTAPTAVSLTYNKNIATMPAPTSGMTNGAGGNDAVNSKWYVVTSNPANGPVGQVNYGNTVVGFCLNSTTSFVPANTAIPAGSFRIESKFYQNSVFATEFHISQIQGASGGFADFRSYSAFVPHLPADWAEKSGVSYRSAYHDFTDGSGTARFQMNLRTSDGGGNIALNGVGTSNLKFRYDKNNDPVAQQINAANNAFLTLPYYDDRDVLRTPAGTFQQGPAPSAGVNTTPGYFKEDQNTTPRVGGGHNYVFTGGSITGSYYYNYFFNLSVSGTMYPLLATNTHATGKVIDVRNGLGDIMFSMQNEDGTNSVCFGRRASDGAGVIALGVQETFTNPGIEIAQTGQIVNLPGAQLKISGTKVLGTQGAAVADATDAASVIARLNDLLARCRAHGLIAT
jgi:hypothetical protein